MPVILAQTPEPVGSMDAPMTTWPWIVAGLVVLGLLWWSGLLAPRQLRRGPDRRIGMTPFDLVAALGLMLIGMALALAITQLLSASWPNIFHASDKASNQALAIPPLGAAILLIVNQLCMRGLPTGYFLWRIGMARRGFSRMGCWPRLLLRDIVVAAIGLVVAVALVLGTQAAAQVIGMLFHLPPPEPVNHVVLQMITEAQAWWVAGLLVLSAVVLAPLLEELLFRGFLQSVLVEWFGRRRVWSALLLASAIFSLSHVGATSWHALAALFVFSIILGWVYERYGSLWIPVLMHMGFNALNVIAAMLLMQ